MIVYKLKLLPVVYQDLIKARKWYLEINKSLNQDHFWDNKYVD